LVLRWVDPNKGWMAHYAPPRRAELFS